MVTNENNFHQKIVIVHKVMILRYFTEIQLILLQNDSNKSI
jgi:hypothetical protein